MFLPPANMMGNEVHNHLGGVDMTLFPQPPLPIWQPRGGIIWEVYDTLLRHFPSPSHQIGVSKGFVHGRMHPADNECDTAGWFPHLW